MVCFPDLKFRSLLRSDRSSSRRFHPSMRGSCPPLVPDGNGAAGERSGAAPSTYGEASPVSATTAPSAPNDSGRIRWSRTRRMSMATSKARADPSVTSAFATSHACANVIAA